MAAVSTGTESGTTLNACGDAHVRAFMSNLALDANAHGKPWRALTKPGDRCTISDSEVPGHSMKMFRAVCELPLGYSPRDVFEQVCVPSNRQSWDSALASLEVHTVSDSAFKLSDGTTEAIKGFFFGGSETAAELVSSCSLNILHCVTKAVYAVSARDFVDVGATVWLANGSMISAGATVDHELPGRLYPARSGVVRGFDHPGCGWFLEAVQRADGVTFTRMHYIIHSDIKGWVPHAVVNAAMVKNFETFFTALAVQLAHGGTHPSPA